MVVEDMLGAALLVIHTIGVDRIGGSHRVFYALNASPGALLTPSMVSLRPEGNLGIPEARLPYMRLFHRGSRNSGNRLARWHVRSSSGL